LNVVFFKADVVMLSVLEPQAVADTNIALYGVPMKIVEVGMMFGTVFLNSMLPVLTEAMKKGVAELEPLVKKAYSLLFFFGAGTALFLAVAAAPVVEFISNANYVADGPSGYDSVDAMHIVAFVFFFFFLSSLFTYLLVAAGEQKRLLKINGGIAVANIIGNALVIPTHSFVGAAAVTLVSQIFLLFLTARAAGRVVGSTMFFLKETLAVSGLALGSSAICFFVLRNVSDM
jgi:O-antigen/teichoic acid export membrane protein